MGIDLEVEVLSRAGHSERNCGPTNRNRMWGGAEQGERTKDRKSPRDQGKVT